MSGSYARLCDGAAKILDRPLTTEEASAIWKHLDLMESWNRVHRLVGSADRDWMVENLILDSLLFLRVIPVRANSLLDIGSGAGVPGIPIKIVCPTRSIVMAESRRRRASFLANAVRTLGLRDTKVFHGRAESLVSESPRFDAVVARCADAVDRVLHLGIELTGPGGMVVVAGPPEPTTLALGSWRQVLNPVTGHPRNFVVVTKPDAVEVVGDAELRVARPTDKRRKGL